MEIPQALILGIIEGLTEFLPVSSTGHLILTAYLLNIPHNSFTKTFEISIQLGSILAVFFVYFKKLIKDLETWKRIILAFIPTGILGFLFYKFIKTYLIGNDLVVAISLILGGVVLLFVDRFLGKKGFSDIKDLEIRKVPMIGVFQSLAMIPGVSRSAATIIGGMLLGLNRRAATEFSFLLALPTIFTATTYDLYKSFSSINLSEWKVLTVGFFAAFITALITVRAFIKFVSRYNFTIFGIYRILVGIVYLVLFY